MVGFCTAESGAELLELLEPSPFDGSAKMILVAARRPGMKVAEVTSERGARVERLFRKRFIKMKIKL